MHTYNRILINTIAQYIRSILNMIFNLIATRLILKNLGVIDYGIYSLIAGIVTLLAFITNSLVVTTQRFLSVELESGVRRLVKVLSSSIFIHIVIALALFIILELASLPLFDNILSIDEERIYAAKLLYQLTIITMVVAFISAPFKALIVAHENIVFTSFVEIMDGLLKLCIAFSLIFFIFDKLIIYGIFLLFIQIFNLIALCFYAYKNYSECKEIRYKYVDFGLIKEISRFAGWTVYAVACVTGRSQGIAVLINRFFGVVINASYGLAFQVAGAVIAVSQSLLNAINPQLMKSEGVGNRKKMMQYSEIESKFAFLLLCAISVPAIFEMPQLLSIWLVDVPNKAVILCQMVLIANCMDMLTIGLNSANQAMGKIGRYTRIIYTIKFLTLPLVYFLFLYNSSLELMCMIYITMELLSSLIRIPYLKKSAGLCIKSFIRNTFAKEAIPLIVLIITCYLIVSTLEMHYRFLLTFIIPNFLFAISIMMIGLSSTEKNILYPLLKKVLKINRSCYL